MIWLAYLGGLFKQEFVWNSVILKVDGLLINLSNSLLYFDFYWQLLIFIDLHAFYFLFL